MRILPFAALPALLTGCIVYDNDGPDRDHDDDRDYGLEDEDRDTTEQPEEEAEPAPVFAFEPDQAEVGDAFIGYLSVVEGDVDLSAATEVVVYGDLQLSDWDARSDELVLAIDIDGQAQPGLVDILIEIDGKVFVAESALEVFEAASGHGVDDGASSAGGDDSTDCD